MAPVSGSLADDLEAARQAAADLREIVVQAVRRDWPQLLVLYLVLVGCCVGALLLF